MSGSDIRDDFSRLVHDSGSLARQAASRARHATSGAAHQALDGVRHTFDRPRDGVVRYYHHAGDSIREHPAQALLVAGAIGFLLGVAALAACSTCYQRYKEEEEEEDRNEDRFEAGSPPWSSSV